MVINNILGIIGLIIDIIGVLIIFFNTPTFNSKISDYSGWDNNKELKKKYFEPKCGLILIIFGFILQLLNYLTA